MVREAEANETASAASKGQRPPPPPSPLYFLIVWLTHTPRVRPDFHSSRLATPDARLATASQLHASTRAMKRIERGADAENFGEI